MYREKEVRKKKEKDREKKKRIYRKRCGKKMDIQEKKRIYRKKVRKKKKTKGYREEEETVKNIERERGEEGGQVKDNKSDVIIIL